MIPKTSWIVFTVDATGVETKVDFVLSTKIPDDKLEEILRQENKKRRRHKKPLRYEEFNASTKDPILFEAQRQFMRDEGDELKAEFENFENEITKEEARLERESIKETAPPKPPKPEKRKKASSQTNDKRKGGRPSNAEYSKIFFAIIKMLLSFKKNQTINNIKTLDTVADKINRQLREMKSDVRINVRQLDIGKTPGRFFRFFWAMATGVYAWDYDEYKMGLDYEMIDVYIKKFSKAWNADERLKSRLDNLMEGVKNRLDNLT